MNVNLYSANIQIRNKENNILYQQSCSSKEELNTFIEKYGQSKKAWSWMLGTVLVLRTKGLRDFSKDFFLPAFVNFALKIHNFALKLIASIFAIVLDVVTLPIRILTTPFRMYHNHQHPVQEHPIINLIRGNPLFQKTIDNNFVKIYYEEKQVQISNGESYNQNLSTEKKSIPVFLKRAPS